MSKFVKVMTFVGRNPWFINIDQIVAVDIENETIYTNAVPGINGKFLLSRESMEELLLLLSEWEKGADK